MKKCLYPGTFNPPTLGHLDIIQRASKMCDELIVGISLNHQKDFKLLSSEEREEMLKEITKDLPNVTVIPFSGLMVDFAQENQINFVIRSLRAFSDLESEFRMALANRKMSGLETVFLISDEKHSHISSTLVREIGSYGHRLHDFVPPQIEEQVFRFFQKDTHCE